MTRKKFGAFAGVFTPSILTILGVIMYLRLGWVVGQSGLFAALVIILVAHVISITTGLSITAIATDKKIKTGGIYYILSRSLGLPMGGAIGITLFVGTALSIALYLVGFTESVFAIEEIQNFLGMDGDINDIRIVASIVLLFLVIIAFISTSLAIKSQFFILGAIVLSLVSILLGFFSNVEFHPAEVVKSAAIDHIPWETIFAVFFPAVTGFTAGVAMSGDLKDPKKSIPLGTLGSIFVGLIVYIGLAIGFAFFVDRDILINDTNFLIKIALFSPIVIAGIWGATLSSAMGGILGAPRILQAVALDKILPKILAKGHGVNNEPRNALILSFIIAEAGILIGELNAIAEVVSMFYIAAYGFINLSFALEKWASTDFRPSFRIPGWVGIIGFLASFGVMFKMNTMAMFAAMIIVGIIYLLLKRKQQQLDFGDVWQSVWTALIRTSLHRLDNKEIEDRNWSPNIILFSGGTEKRPHLVELGKNLVGKHGFLSNFDLIENKKAKVLFPKYKQSVQDELSKEYQGIFFRKQTVKDLYSGIETISQTYGFSGLEPNTVLLGWDKNRRDPVRFVKMIKTITELDLNIIMVDYDRTTGFGKYETIDIWWRGGGHNGNFALSLIKFLWVSDQWRNSRLRLLIVNPNNEARDKIERDTYQILDNLRIRAEVRVINNQIERRTFYEIIRTESGNTDLVFLGIPNIEEGSETDFVKDTYELCRDIGTVILLRASTRFKELSLGSGLFKKPQSPQSIEIKLEEPQQDDLKKLDLIGPIEVTDQLYQVAKELENLFIKTIDSQQNNLNSSYSLILNELSGQFNKSFDHWTDSIANPDDVTIKLNQSLVLTTRIRKLINAEYKDQLEYSDDQIKVLLSEHVDQIKRIFEQVPKKMQLTFTKDRLQANEDDPFGDRWYKWKKRVKADWTKKPVKYNIKTRNLLHGHLQVQSNNLLAKFLQHAGLLHFQNHILLKKLSSQISNEVMTLDKYAHYQKLNPDIINESRLKITQWIKEYSTKNTALSSALRQNTTNEIKKQVQNQLSILDDINPNRFQLTESEIVGREKNARKIINSAPKYYQRNQFLLGSELRLATLLDFFSAQISSMIIQLRKGIVLEVESVFEQLNQGISETLDKKSEVQILNTIEPGLDQTIIKIRTLKENTFKRINQLTGRLPNHIQIIDKASSEKYKDLQFKHFGVIDIAFSQLLNYMVQNEILLPFEQLIKQYEDTFEKDYFMITDTHRLIRLSFQKPEPGQTKSQLNKQRQEQVEKLTLVQSTFKDNLSQTDRKIAEINSSMVEKLQFQAFIELTADQKQYTKSLESKNRYDRIKTNWETSQRFIKERYSSLVYLISKGTIAAHNYIKSEEESLFQKVRKEIDRISPDKTLLDQIPFFYKQLFLSKQHYLSEFWIGREKELENYSHLLDQNQSISKGIILINGEHNSGKTFWLQYTSALLPKDQNLYLVQHSTIPIADIKSFNTAIRKSTNSSGNIDQVMEQLPHGSVIAIDDLEKWWRQEEKGDIVINHLVKLIQKYAHKIKFILAIDTHSYKILRAQTDFGHLQPYIISTKPMNAREIARAIKKRHYSGGLTIGGSDDSNGRMNTIEEARFFSRIFSMSFGNIGHAMMLWMASIERIEDKTLYLKKLDKPDMRFMKELPSEWNIILNRFISHKFCKKEDFEPYGVDIIEALHEMIRSGLINEKTNGVLAINDYIHPYIINHFKHFQLI